MTRSLRLRLLVMLAVVVALLLTPLGVAQARWHVIAGRAADPIAVCADGIIFGFTDEFYNDGIDYSGKPDTSISTFKAAFPVPPPDVNTGGYFYPVDGTIIAVQKFTTYKFHGDPWGIDTSDPTDGVDDAFLVYKGMSAVRWDEPRSPGDEILLTWQDFSPGETSPIVTVQDCTVFSIDIKPGSSGAAIDRGSKYPIEVAILKRPGFNPTSVDKSTVRFGPTGYEAKALSWKWRDADHDGDVDLVFKFNIKSLRLQCGQTAAFLSAQTSSGDFFGADYLKPVNCKNPPPQGHH